MLLSLPSVAWPKALIRSLVMDLVRGPRRSPPPSRRSPSRRSRFGPCLSWGVELGPLPSIPLFDEDKSLVLVFDLIESEAVPAKIAFILSNASYNSRLDFYIFKA